MKRILITGAGSYIGTSFAQYIERNFPECYTVDTVDMLNGEWREQSFSGYDTVFHVAGIAHRKETEEIAHLYYEVNRDLADEVAQKAKADGVGQFIFLSSMSVYGMNTGIITRNTVPSPSSHYGKSKLQAEEKLNARADDSFRVCIVRPPMVYGNGCRGNFQTVIKLVRKFPVFPKLKNERSMIYIDNLCEFIRLCVDKELSGLYFPQNKTYMNTSGMAAWIAQAMDKKPRQSALLGACVKLCRPFLGILQKSFGSLVYRDTEDFTFSYVVCDTCESVKKSV